MNRSEIPANVKRRLYAESMGRCMNPNCQADLFHGDGDISEKAHIVPYSVTMDNSFDNLVLLCPNCHTDFDKNNAFSAAEVSNWKKIRQQELDSFFNKHFNSFEVLCKEIVPLLSDNKMLYEKYYIGNQRNLWDKFEAIILGNNRKIKKLLENNFELIQKNKGDYESNQDYVRELLIHIDEFEATRADSEKIRATLFPDKINSIFGIEPLHGGIIPMTEALEDFISKTNCQEVVLGVEQPYVVVNLNGNDERIYLDDGPRLRQLYYSFGCFRKVGIRLQSLNFALRYLKDRNIPFRFCKKNNLREIECLGDHIMFVYEYCLSKNDLQRMLPEENTVIVNLHNWNGEGCISKEAYEFAGTIGVTLLTMDKFYAFIRD